MRKIILITVVLLVAMTTKSNAQENDSTKHQSEWSYRQPEGESYEIGLDKSPEFANQNVFTIKSIKNKTNGFGNIMKAIRPDAYLGKTVKMTAYVKAEKVKSWAGLWMRVDYYTTDVLAFDNMQKRPIKGTKDWTKYEVVLYVPTEATSILYGVLLDESGQIWFKDVSLEIVDDSIAETGPNKGRDHKVIPFETRAKAIGNQIKAITTAEKDALKSEIELIEKDLEKGIISKDQADGLKLQKAKVRASNIELKVAAEQVKLNKLIQDKVDGKIEDSKEYRSFGKKVVFGNNQDPIGPQTEINVTSMKVYNGQEDKDVRQSKRTTSQFIFATGLNNLATDGEVENSDFRFLGSHFYEWGISYNSRLAKNSNLLHAKYGLSLMYNNLRPTDNRRFVVNGNQTNLEVNPVNMKDSRFRNVYLVLPVHLEFDFSGKEVKKDKTYFKTHKAFRFGLGGYAGINLKSKQIIKYDIDDHDVNERTRGDFNTSNFIYGLSTYIGYKETSLYVKYDLNPLFKDNIIKQNNVSLGIRFDLN